jgi:tRNA (cmo5U34)-methyltransferase
MKKFDFNTIDDFDNHILKSIPNYDVLLGTIKSISDYFVTKDTIIYDLGCSTGKFLKGLPYDNLKIGYDNAKLMPEYDSEVEFLKVDLDGKFEIKNACLVYSIFTMQFLNRISRANFCKTIYDGLNVGGAFILCEKIYQESGIMQEVLSFSHYDYKCQYFTEEEIVKKERDLRFIMKPNTMQENLKLLYGAGFTNIVQFWQSYNFVGLIAIK